MDKIEELTEQFSKFPGVGPRQARRMVYFLLRQNRTWLSSFTGNVSALKNTVAVCDTCCRHFTKPLQGGVTTCSLCRDTTRTRTTLLIVEKDVDLENMERSGSYHGAYFVLGGTYQPLKKEPAALLRLAELIHLTEKRLREGTLQEIIIALGVNPDGEETTQYLEDILAPLIQETSCMVSVLGRGLSTGSELEYADPETLQHALQGRVQADIIHKRYGHPAGRTENTLSTDSFEVKDNNKN